MPGRVGEVAEGGRDGQGGQRRQCHEAGTFLTTKIHPDDEKVTKPDAAYTTGQRLGVFGTLYADGDLTRESPVRDLLAFAKARKAEPSNRR